MARKLKKYVIPTSLGILGISTLLTVPFYLRNDLKEDSGYRYTVSEIKEKIYPVINEVEEKIPMRPFLEETVAKTKDYYQKTDDEQTQINSLMYYDKTYMPSTGILYTSDEGFDVVASVDGIVKKVASDNILGNYIVIEHSNGYKTMYYSLSETTVTENQQVVKGDVIGISGPNKLESSSQYNLLFEVYKDGKLTDPEDFYNIDFNQLN